MSGMSLPNSALEEIKRAWAQSVYEGFLTEEAEGIVRRELALQATYQPAVEIKMEGDESVRTLVIDVTPGPRAERTEVRLEGMDERLTAELLREVGDRAHALQALTNSQEYERTVLTALRARGYSQASVTVGVPIFDETKATVPVTVETGPQFRVGVVSFEGANGVPLDDLRAEAGLQEGAVYRADDVEAARARLQARYRREGFSMASVQARENVRASDAAVDVTFVVQEGPRQVIKEIVIAGAQSVDEDIVRQTLRLKIGDSLRTADWLEARRRLFVSGLFRRVDIVIEPLEGAADTAPVKLRVEVEEWPALRLRYGFQVAEERPEENVEGREISPGVSVDLTRRILFGRAITIGLSGQYENLERVGRVFTNLPTLFRREIQSSLTLERSREEIRNDTLVTTRTTAAFEQRGRWRKLSLVYGLRFEQNRTFDTEQRDFDPLFPQDPFDVTVHIGRLTASAIWDTRDDPSDSTRGTFVSTSLENATARLGSDLLFIRSLTQAYHFWSWKKVVLASAVRYGAVAPRGDQVLVSSARFFAGGARTVRGVFEDSFGRARSSGRAARGQGPAHAESGSAVPNL